MNEEINASHILVKRTAQWANRLRSIAIFIDGKNIGQVKNGEDKEFPIAPGEHEVFAKIDWCKAPPVKISVPLGQTEILNCGSEISGWKLLLTIFYLFMPSRWIYLRKEADSASSKWQT